jgi:phosphoacetylglucosamine mutase
MLPLMVTQIVLSIIIKVKMDRHVTCKKSFFLLVNSQFQLLDGDKIAALVALFIRDCIQVLDLVESVSIGVIQTAYSNGASTRFFKDTLHLNVECVSTGIKNLHLKAKEFDIGIYFEANGHGTVVFSSKFRTCVQALLTLDVSCEAFVAANKLLSLAQVLHPTIGDAMSDLLMVEGILFTTGMSLSSWDALFTLLPNQQRRVFVKDKNIIQTRDADRIVTHPAHLQALISSACEKYPLGRGFVR